MTGAIEKHGSHMKLSIDFFFFSVAGRAWRISPVGVLNCCGGEGEGDGRLSVGRWWRGSGEGGGQ